ncbi:MAG: hypothetical protein AAF604_04820 [Acidobacteriota bacterium]
MERRLRKLKVKDGKVTILFEQLSEATGLWDEYAFTCWEKPLPELGDALHDLVVDVLAVCRLPDGYRSGLKVAGVSCSYAGDDGDLGATITALKTLGTANSPLVLNTPYLSVTGDPGMSDEMEARLATLELHAFAYVDGRRAQGNLFEDAA